MLLRCILTTLVAGGYALVPTQPVQAQPSAVSPATDVAIGAPTAVVTDATGNLYFAVSRAYLPGKFEPAVFKMDSAGVLTRVAGNGVRVEPRLFEDYPPAFGDGGPATRAQLIDPVALALDGAGNLYIADGAGGRVRKVSPEGIITTAAGGVGLYRFEPGDNGDGGPATRAHLFYPCQLAVDPDGSLYIGEWNTTRVRKVSPDGIINTVIGNGVPGYAGDGGLAAGAQIGAPWGLAFDYEGNLYISDDIPGDDYGPDATHIRKVSPEGTITTIAGIGTLGYSGDGGPATAAQIDAAGPLTVDSSGNIYFAGESRIRKISSDGIISTIAGDDKAAYSGDGGPAASAEVSWSPHGIGLALAADGNGNLYIADTGNYRIRRISPDGIISTVAGNGTCCYEATANLAPAHR
jgi:sugar lactone lactonase YvrE